MMRCTECGEFEGECECPVETDEEESMQTIAIPQILPRHEWNLAAIERYTDDPERIRQMDRLAELVGQGKIMEALDVSSPLTYEDIRTAICGGLQWPASGAQLIAQALYSKLRDARGAGAFDKLLMEMEKVLASIGRGLEVAQAETQDRADLEAFADVLRTIKAPVIRSERGNEILDAALAKIYAHTLSECLSLSLNLSSTITALPEQP